MTFRVRDQIRKPSTLKKRGEAIDEDGVRCGGGITRKVTHGRAAKEIAKERSHGDEEESQMEMGYDGYRTAKPERDFRGWRTARLDYFKPIGGAKKGYMEQVSEVKKHHEGERNKARAA